MRWGHSTPPPHAQPATLRDRLLAWVESGSDTVAWWQARFGVRGGKPTNPVWHAIFHVGATFGNEVSRARGGGGGGGGRCD
jgi:hypothetical protein